MSTPTLPLESRSPGDPRRQSDAVVFENVELAFERKVVLDDISFRLAHGETKAIFGVAGSGKSTILKLALVSSWARDRKSTRLNSSHSQISYAVFCLKKK